LSSFNGRGVDIEEEEKGTFLKVDFDADSLRQGRRGEVKVGGCLKGEVRVDL